MLSKVKKFLARIIARKQYIELKPPRQANPFIPVSLDDEEPVKVEKTCPICGEKFTTTTPQKVFCSDECFKENSRRRQRIYYNIKKEPPEEKVCKHCGKKFTPKNQRQIFCSDACQRAFRHPQKLLEKTCAICGEKFTTNRSCQIYCSKECAAEGHRRKVCGLEMPKAPQKPKKRYETERICPQCGKPFSTTNPSRKFCSKECLDTYHADLRKTKKKSSPHFKHFTCLNCGQGFYAERDSGEKFCCESCKREFTSYTGITYTPIKRKKSAAKKSIADWQAEAAQCGMTYGQYRTAIERLGKTFEELKLPEPAPAEEKILFECKI